MNCNRLTKAKKPCQNPACFYTACRIHATEEDKAIDKFAWDMWSQGYKKGEESGRTNALAEVEQAKRKAEHEAEEKKNFKLRTVDGLQIVACGKYSYIVPAHLPDLKVGDKVRLPSNWLVSHPSDAEVTALGTSYTGELSKILSVIP